MRCCGLLVGLEMKWSVSLFWNIRHSIAPLQQNQQLPKAFIPFFTFIASSSRGPLIY
jgi:hypothetical protein